jgi:hypothetical protein
MSYSDEPIVYHHQQFVEVGVGHGGHVTEMKIQTVPKERGASFSRPPIGTAGWPVRKEYGRDDADHWPPTGDREPYQAETQRDRHHAPMPYHSDRNTMMLEISIR